MGNISYNSFLTLNPKLVAISTTLLQILEHLADGEFHSGSELAKITGISRSAICKQLHGLEKLGIDYTAISGKGYKLSRPLQLLDKQAITQHLNISLNDALATLEIHPCLASTNSRVKQTGHASCCLAEYQTHGRGRRGRSWISPFGSNIYLSLCYHYQSGPAVISGLSLAVGVAVIKALKKLGITDAGLKWPNDIFWQQQKLGGILIEVDGEAEGPCQVTVGLGLNVFLPDFSAQQIDQPWIDLYRIMGEKAFFSRNLLVAELLNQLIPLLENFESTGLTPFLDSWRKHDCMKNQTVTLYQGKYQHQGVFAGIDQDGHCLIKNTSGKLQTFASGEVSFRSS
jgi:BirA family biotin operon repressor/biotin-[acetyl-CoA-carboxylase] ligase